MSAREKFWALVAKAGPDECWPWRGKCNAKGYGSFPWSPSKYAETLAHRFAFVQANPPRIPLGAMILHSCDNPPCCNPAHLRIGTAADNAADRDGKGRHAKGESHGRAKLTEDDVRAIRADPRPHKEIAADYGIHYKKISPIKSGKTWAHVPSAPLLHQDPCK